MRTRSNSFELRTWALLIGMAVCTQSLHAAAKVSTGPVPGGGKPMAARTDAAGTIQLVYDCADGPKYTRSVDGGRTLERAIPIVDQASRKPG